MSNIPLLIQGTGLVLIALLIPIWISLFRNEEKQMGKLDERILVDYILGGKDILYAIGLVFVSPIFWELKLMGIKFLIIVLSGFGIFILFRKLSLALNWMGGGEFSLRFDFLEKLNSTNIKREYWNMIWEIKKIEYNNEKRFLEIFFSKIDKLINIKNTEILDTVSAMLKDFQESLDNRSIDNILRNKFFDKILDLHYKTWVKIMEFPEESTTNSWDIIRSQQFFAFLNQAIKKITFIAFKEEPYPLYYFSKAFFEALKKHVTETKNNIEESKNLGQYLQMLFPFIYREIFDRIRISFDSYSIWKYFPQDWKITREKLESNDKIVETTKNFYKEWVYLFLIDSNNLYRKKILEISENLFPDISAYKWSAISIALCPPSWGPTTTKFRVVIEIPWGFNEGDKEESEEKIRNTYKLALIMYPNKLTNDYIKRNIEGFKKLKGKYSVDSPEEEKRKEFVEIFSSLKNIKGKNQI